MVLEPTEVDNAEFKSELFRNRVSLNSTMPNSILKKHGFTDVDHAEFGSELFRNKVSHRSTMPDSILNYFRRGFPIPKTILIIPVSYTHLTLPTKRIV